jgi:hypothetical protein
MFGNYFYNESLRKMTVAFGTLFNNIRIESKSDTGSITKKILVPLAYAPKEKFLVRLEQKPDLNERQFAITLPRMGFEISGINYDASRKLTRVVKYKQVKPGTNGKVFYTNYVPVPYNINYNLHCFTATAENGLQIIEQILPFFQPDYTITLNILPDMNIVRDVPIVLNNITYEDNYTGDFSTRRAVIYNLNFTAKTYLYGPMTTQGVITKVQTDISGHITPDHVRDERIIVVPSPTNASPDSDFGFTTTIE